VRSADRSRGSTRTWHTSSTRRARLQEQAERNPVVRDALRILEGIVINLEK
jgi:hypothetical protein